MKREWLIQSRKAKKMTQEQVAYAAFIDRGYYSQIETGKRNPSFNVASNIAKVLNFDQMLFFGDYENKEQFTEISYNFSEMFGGEILYLYDNTKTFCENLFVFLLKGVEKGCYCIVIDYINNLNYIKQRLQTILPKDDSLEKIRFINKKEIEQLNPKELIDKYRDLYSYFTDGYVHIWLTEKQYDENDWIYNLNSYLNTNVDFNNNNILFVRSYCASVISAGLYIKMMKSYPYLMTDSEIVHSPFYYSKNKWFILPSFFMQENS